MSAFSIAHRTFFSVTNVDLYQMFHCYKKIKNQKNAKDVFFILDSLQ